MENLMAIQNNADAWDVESVYSYLNRLVAMGTPTTSTDTEPTQTPVQTYLSIFASITLSRLDCLLCDYTGCLEALVPLDTHGLVVVPKEKFNLTVTQVIHSVLSARLSLVYHAGIAKIMLRRYKDAIRTLGELCAYLQVNYFRAGGGSRKGGDHQQQQWMKQYDRMLSLLAILIRICPNNHGLNESVVKAVRDKFSATTAAAGPKDLFACPKFIAIQEHQQDGMMQQQIQQFHQEMELVIDNKLPFYLKLYTSLPMSKLGETDDVSAQLLSYKARMHPRDRDGSVHSSDAALDVHYYVTADSVVHVSADSSRERRLEPWYCANIQHVRAIGRDAAAIRTTV
jgi:translation initiation factor 3 subunit L